MKRNRYLYDVLNDIRGSITVIDVNDLSYSTSTTFISLLFSFRFQFFSGLWQNLFTKLLNRLLTIFNLKEMHKINVVAAKNKIVAH